MKKLSFILFALMLTTGVFAQNWRNSREITSNQLPSPTQTYITNHFGGLNTVTNARQWDNNFTVYTQSGQKLKFNMDGSLREAKAENNVLPKSLLGEYNSSILNYINTNYSDWDLVEIEVKRSKLEIELERGRSTADIEFNTRTGEVLDVDIDN